MTPRDNRAIKKHAKSIYEIPRRRYRWQQKVLNVFSGFPFPRCVTGDVVPPDAQAPAPKWAAPGT
jgi:hypothetical protein